MMVIQMMMMMMMIIIIIQELGLLTRSETTDLSCHLFSAFE
jgi:hypothetical protein